MNVCTVLGLSSLVIHSMWAFNCWSWCYAGTQGSYFGKDGQGWRSIVNLFKRQGAITFEWCGFNRWSYFEYPANCFSAAWSPWEHAFRAISIGLSEQDTDSGYNYIFSFPVWQWIWQLVAMNMHVENFQTTWNWWWAFLIAMSVNTLLLSSNRLVVPSTYVF